MKPGAYNLDIVGGADFGPLLLRLKNADETPVILNGSSVSAHIRTAPDGAIIADIAPVISDFDAGEITMHLDSEQTRAIKPGKYGWDMILTDVTGRKTRIIAGAVSVVRAYTNPE